MLAVILMGLWIVLAFTAPHFATMENQLGILRNVSMQGIIAFGMTMVIIAGEIDLSVGSAVAFSGCLAAWIVKALIKSGAGGATAVCAGILAALAVGFLIGCLTGWIRTRFEVPTFITTLAWLTVLTGVARLITGGYSISDFPDWYNFLGGGYVARIPFPAIIFLLSFLIVQGVMSYTSFGRAIYAIGGNPEAARLSGIRVARVKILVMGIVALLAALSGLLQASQIMSGTATTAKGWELDVISAVIIGGASLAGGAGTVWGTLIGIIFLGVLVNGMTLRNINEDWQLVVRGALILSAVLINRLQAGRRA